MMNKRLAQRVGGIALPLLAALGLNVAIASAADAAISNCPWITRSCSTYTSVEETHHLYISSRGPVGAVNSELCDAVFPDTGWPGKGSTQAERDRYFTIAAIRGDCKQLTITQRDRDRLNAVIMDAHRQNACIEFYKPVGLKKPGWIVERAEVYSGKKFCKQT